MSDDVQKQADPFLITQELCRHYGRGESTVRAVDGVDIQITQGEFVAIVGSSGSGKSTLLNLLAGLDQPTSGSITVAGAPLAKLSSKELSRYRASKVGIVFQSFNLIPHYTALQNVELALYFGETDPTQRRPMAEAILEKLGLKDRMDHIPMDLSGGEQQRVAIARSLVKRPEILLADEPTGNLDQDNSMQIASLLSELNRAGLTVILVSHDEALARDHAHRMIRMHYGKVTHEEQLH